MHLRPLKCALVAAMGLIGARSPCLADATTPSVSASGHAGIHVGYDTATLSLGVTTHAPTAPAASDQVDAAGHAILDALARVGVPAGQVETVDDEVGPMPAEPGRPRPPGYQARIGYAVHVDDVTRVGAVLAAAVAAGANDVGGIAFGARSDRQREERLLAEAVTDARARADAMAKAAGMRLGNAISIQSTGGRLLAAPMLAAGSARSSPVPSGGTDDAVDVETTWMLLAP